MDLHIDARLRGNAGAGGDRKGSAGSLTPYDLARRVYETEPCARSFEEDVFLHLQHGYVIARPDAFAMARPVWRHWSCRGLASPWVGQIVGWISMALSRR